MKPTLKQAAETLPGYLISAKLFDGYGGVCVAGHLWTLIGVHDELHAKQVGDRALGGPSPIETTFGLSREEISGLINLNDRSEPVQRYHRVKAELLRLAELHDPKPTTEPEPEPAPLPEPAPEPVPVYDETTIAEFVEKFFMQEEPVEWIENEDFPVFPSKESPVEEAEPEEPEEAKPEEVDRELVLV